MITEMLSITREVSSLPWAVQYFFLIGLSTGCLFASIPGLVLGRSGWREPARPALIGALACGLAAPVALLADLHQPGRFLNFYLHPQPSSWMSWGSFFIPLYLGGLMLYAAAALWCPRLARIAAAPALVGAALILLYTGAEVMVIAARPLWHSPAVPLAFLLSAVAGGLALTRLLANATDADPLGRPMRWTLAALAAVLAAWLAVGLGGASAAGAEALSEAARLPGLAQSGLWLVLLLAASLLGAHRFPLVSSLCTLALAWGLRWTIFIGGQVMPRTAAGPTDYHLPLGSDGWLGMIGMAGLWLALLIVLASVLPRSTKGA